jgi:hypothetical protein
VKKLTAAATAFLAFLIALPLMTAAFVVSSAPAVAQAGAVHQWAYLPATGEWRPPFQQAYAVSARGFGSQFHPIYQEWRTHTGQDMSSLPDARPGRAAARKGPWSPRGPPAVRQPRRPRPRRRGQHLLRPPGLHRPEHHRWRDRVDRTTARGRRHHRDEHRQPPALRGPPERHPDRPHPVHARARRSPSTASRRPIEPTGHRAK